MHKHIFYFTMMLALALATCATAQDSLKNHDKTKAGESAANAWLKLIDAGDYARSWQEAYAMFKVAVTQQDWEQKLRAVRGPLGGLVSRQLKSAEYTTQLPGAPDGEYVVIRYDTSFENKKSAIETVVPALEKEGVWRVSGYFIK